MTKGTYFV